jgi:hypothetical protein
MRPTLPEPILIGRRWKNRGSEAIAVRLGDYKGCALIDIRTWSVEGNGVLKPSTKGLALSVKNLPKLLAATARAVAEARLRGLLDEDAK